MAWAHVRIHHYLLVTATLCVIAGGSRSLAGDTTVSPRPHSLIHRQTPEVMPADAGTPTPPPSTSGTPATRPPQRKLTKRPAQLPVTGASNDPVTPQPTAGSQQPVSTPPIQKAGTESRMSMATAGAAALGAPAASAAVATAAGTTSATPSGMTAPSSPKPPMASAVPGIGSGTPVPQGVVAGRGLQSLSSQMPGLTQLVTPTVVVSSPPSASQPAPSSFLPPSSLPPGTGAATLSWTLNSESSLAGYKIYVGTASGLYNYPGSPFVVGVTSSYTIAGLPSGQTYYFAISAFDSSGSESGLSTEVSKSIY